MTESVIWSNAPFIQDGCVMRWPFLWSVLITKAYSLYVQKALFLLFFLCMWCMCAYVWRCMHAHVCKHEGQRLRLSVFLSHSSPYILRQGLSLEGRASQLVPRIPCVCLLNAGITKGGQPFVAGISVGDGHLKSSVDAGAGFSVNDLSIPSSPHTQLLLFETESLSNPGTHHFC